MALHSRLHVLNSIIEIGLMPLFYHPDVETSKKVIDAIVDGGARAIEFTNRGDFAINVFTELAQYYAKERPELILGIGSVVDAPTAAMYIANGANFVVGPMLNPEVARLCNRRKIAYLPGCGTLTEISQAEELGVEICKVFPGKTIGGPDFIKAAKAPSPWTRLLPTGGVSASQENIQSWFDAGVDCVGMGSKLVTKQDIADGNYVAITERTSQVLAWIEAVKK